MQKVMKTDAGRQEDIVYQIGASKAIRNVICNALEFFANYAADEAKASIVEKVGKRVDYYREKIVTRLGGLKIDIKRVEQARGRPLKEWIATDLARTIAELQAIQDGMATADETYPTPAEKPSQEEQAAAATRPAEDQSAPEQTQNDAAQPATGDQKQPDPIGVAAQRGWDARKAGMQRKAVPPEYREASRKAEADAWLAGYDRRVHAEADEEK